MFINHQMHGPIFFSGGGGWYEGYLSLAGVGGIFKFARGRGGGVRGIFSVILQCRFKKFEFIGDGGLVHVYSWQAYKYICSVRVHD